LLGLRQLSGLVIPEGQIEGLLKRQLGHARAVYHERASSSIQARRVGAKLALRR
jgi:hypothetical protein